MRRWWLVVFGIVLLGTLSTACGGDDSETESGSPSPQATMQDPPAMPEDETPREGDVSTVDPCELLTVDEVAAVLEGAIGEPAGNNVLPLLPCEYPREDGTAFVDLEVYTGSREDVENYFESGEGDWRDVEGLGEAAHWAELSGQIEVLQGNYALTITVSAPGGGSQLEAAKGLAQKALQRLPR